MKLRQALRLAGAGALTGALLLGTAPPASADDIRDRQWALDAFAATEVWEHATGQGAIVAVVDSGVDASHPDLQGQVLRGKDFTAEGGSAREDEVGHGTGLASLIAGQGHGPGGSAGVKGLAPGAKILPIRTSHGADEGQSSWADGVRYAVDHGADVINISLGTGKSEHDAQAVRYAIRNDVIVVAASGNEGIEVTNYPAAYPGVVSVGGIDDRGAVWEQSAWGSNVSLLAPAAKNVIADSEAESGYALANGTSGAAAYVSAAAALVREAHPKLTAGQVINRLIKTAKIPQGESVDAKLPNEKFGYGIIRPLRAVTYDIPAGPEEGPLTQTAEEETSTSSGSDNSQAAPSDDTPTEEKGGISPIVVGVIVVVGLGILGLVIGLVVKSQRKKQPPYGGGGHGGPAPQQWPGVPPQQPGQQYPPQAGQYSGPPASPPPPPNQPPRQ